MFWTRILPTLAILVLAGAGIGIHLGRTAIGAIDPFHLAEPESIGSYASLSPNPSSFIASQSPPQTGPIPQWGQACAGCPPFDSLFEPRHDGTEDAHVFSAWTPDTSPAPGPALYELEARSLDAMQAGIESRIESEMRLIERYAYYPVSHEAAKAADVAAVPPRNEAAKPAAVPLPEWERETLTY